MDTAATQTHTAPDATGGIRKKRRMTVVTSGVDFDPLSPLCSPTSTIGLVVPTATPTRRLSYQDATRDSARRRWRLLQKHVCITQWLSKDLMRRQLKRFALAQESLVDVLITSKDDFMEVFVKIREQFLSLLDAENCILSFEANRSILEFDGRSILPSTRAKRGGLLRTAMKDGEPVHLFHTELQEKLRSHSLDGVPHAIAMGEIRSYVCLPLIDSEGNVQAVAEVFNSRHDAKIVASWLRAGDNGSLHVLRNFVGNLIKAFTKRANLSDLVSTAAKVPPAQSGGGGACSPRKTAPPSATPSSSSSTPTGTAAGASDAPSASSSGSEINEYPLESLVDFLRHSVGIEYCSVFAFDKDADLLWARLSDCSGSVCPQTVKCDEGIIGKTAKLSETIRYTRTLPEEETDDAIFQELFTNVQLAKDQVHDVVCIPTMNNATQKLNGVVLLLNKQDHTVFNEADLAMCANLCRHIGNALHSSELHEAILKAQGKAQTLLDLSAVLFRELETNALLVAIMDAIKKPMNASKCCVFLMDEDKNELVAPVGSDIAQDLSCSSTQRGVFRTPVSQGIVGAAARQGETINVRDVSHDPRFNGSVDQLTGFVTRSILAVPIKDANGDVLGVLEMVNKLSKQYFDKDDEELARGIAYYLAIALKNAKLFESARTAMRRSDALLAMMQVISSSNENVGDVFRALVDTACQILNVEHGALFFVDALSKTLFCRVGMNWKAYTIPLGKFIPGIVAERGESLVLSRNASAHPDFDTSYDELCGIHSKSLLCVPIKSTSSSSTRDSSNNVVAVFYAVNKMGSTNANGVFCEEDIKIMNSICSELSSIIERRSWELMFLVESSSETSSDKTQVTSSFLSQYTTTPTLPRRKSSIFHSRAPTPISTTMSDDALFQQPQPELPQPIGLRSGLLSKVFNPSKREGDSLDGSGEAALPPPLRSVAAGQPLLIRDWALNPWQQTMPQLVDLVLEMFDYFDLPHRYQIQRATMRRFIVGVKGQYQDIPYHNVFHAFTTLHVSFLIVSSQSSVQGSIASAFRAAHEASLPSLASSHSHSHRASHSSFSTTTTMEAGDSFLASPPPVRAVNGLLETRDLMAIFVAAFCHDMNHNGRTNDFHIRYRTSLAMLYNDQSVLENMHAAACFETMRRPGHDILEHVSVNEYRQMRKSIIRAILATDMHNHATIVGQLHEKLKVDVFNCDDEAHKELLINAIVHCADISGPALPKEIHVKWSLQLLDEFNMQYDDELALGLLPTPYMNAKPGSPELGKLNLAFIDSCVFPLWSIMDTFLEGLGGCMENLQSNRTVWIQMIAEAETTAAAAASAAREAEEQAEKDKQVQAMEMEEDGDDEL